MFPTASRHPKKTSRQDSRRWNLLTTLQTVAAEGTTSRARIARATGLTRAAVSSLVADLISEGLVKELGPGRSDGGKPPTVLALNDRGRGIVAVDVSRSPIHGALVDLAGNIRHRIVGPPDHNRGEAAVNQIEALIEELLAGADAPILGVGIGTPGLVDETGTVVEGANLGWSNVRLRRILTDRFDLPVAVANDAQAAALAEFRFHPAAADGLLLVRLGQGVGAGLVIGGQLHGGEQGAAGEIGHVVIEPGGLECRCGNQGCLETVASVPAIVARISQDGASHVWDALALVAEYGEEPVRRSVETAAAALGSVLAVSVSLLDITQVVIASDLANAGDALVEGVRREMTARMLTPSRSTVHVGTPSTGRDLVLAGVAAIVLRDQLGVVLR